MQSIRATDDPGEMIWIAMELSNRLPQLKHNELFAASIPQFLSLAGYKFMIAEDDRFDQRSAFGLLTFYKAPMIESIFLAVEAMWFRDDENKRGQSKIISAPIYSDLFYPGSSYVKSHANTVVIYLRMIILENIFPAQLRDQPPRERI